MKRRTHFQKVVLLLTAVFMTALLAACGSTATPLEVELEPTNSNATVYKGRATALRSTVLGINVTLADTGVLPSQGGVLSQSVLTANVPGLINAGVLHASTIGQGNDTSSQAAIANIDLTVAGLINIKAEVASSEALASCDSSGRATVSGSSQLVKLVINGKIINVTGEANQRISLLGIGTIIINEQVKSVSGSTGRITVNALRVSVLGTADVVVASSHAEITCKTQKSNHGDVVTGYGKIKTGCGSGCGSFSFTFRKQGTNLSGKLSYVDSAANLKVRATSVAKYTTVDAKTRVVEGKASVNGKTGFRYLVRVVDNGAGKNDTFRITIISSAGKTIYSESGRLVCGNIRIRTSSPACACF